jgi:hypothetical protein
MSWLTSIRDWWQGDKDNQVAKEAKGVSNEFAYSTSPFPYAGQSQTGYNVLGSALSIDQDLMHRFADYENMDDYPELSAILDIYADDSTVPDTIRNRTVWANSKDRVYRDIADDLIYRRLRLEEDIWPLSRSLCKYGNAYGEILMNETGVVGLNYLPAPTMRRIEDEKGALIGFVQDPRMSFTAGQPMIERWLNGAITRDQIYAETGMIFFAPWEIVHWRLRSKYLRSTYGYGVLDSSRWVWKRLQMLEDSALVYKLTRSPARYAFYVDTGDLPPRQAIAYVDDVRRRYKKKKLYNESTGQLEFRYNPLTPDEDFWVPTRGGKESTRIDVISGPDYQSMDDVEYFRGKLVAATKVPKQYLGLGDGQTNKAALAQEDVQFARTAMRIQRELRMGIKQVGRVHFAVLGIDPDVVRWDYEMNSPSSIFEMQQIEVLNARADLASKLDPYYPKEWQLQHVFKMTAEDATFLTLAKADEAAKQVQDAARADSEARYLYPNAEVPPSGPEGMPLEAVADKRLDTLTESAKNGERVLRVSWKRKPS